MRKICNIFLIVTLCLVYLRGMAQSINPSVISSSGATISDNKTIVNWTLGETVIQNISSGNNLLTQGFQQLNYSVNAEVENIISLFDVIIFLNPSAFETLILVDFLKNKINEMLLLVKIQTIACVNFCMFSLYTTISFK